MSSSNLKYSRTAVHVLVLVQLHACMHAAHFTFLILVFTARAHPCAGLGVCSPFVRYTYTLLLLFYCIQ